MSRMAMTMTSVPKQEYPYWIAQAVNDKGEVTMNCGYYLTYEAALRCGSDYIQGKWNMEDPSTWIDYDQVYS